MQASPIKGSNTGQAPGQPLLSGKEKPRRIGSGVGVLVLRMVGHGMRKASNGVGAGACVGVGVQRAGTELRGGIEKAGTELRDGIHKAGMELGDGIRDGLKGAATIVGFCMLLTTVLHLMFSR